LKGNGSDSIGISSDNESKGNISDNKRKINDNNGINIDNKRKTSIIKG
jgi:hypothetical protein